MTTQKRLKELFIMESDVLINKITRRGAREGLVAGSIDRHGYREITVDGKRYRAHRLIWLWHKGVMPENEIDHINQNRMDNSIDNLRDVTHMENHHNMPIQKNSSTGVGGVHWFKRTKKWQAYINVNGVRKNLGYFFNKIDAIEARLLEELEHGFHYNHGKQLRVAP